MACTRLLGTSRHPEHKALGNASHACSCRERWDVEAFLSGAEMASSRAFSKRVGVGLLTKFCKRPHPRTVVFGIIARCYGSVVASGVVLPLRAREGRLKTGVRPLNVAL